ncbi:hypothetical protein ACOXU5_13705 [Vagococcus fluvialis]|uniref:hypothetical protein n=1 Tax=Vagococcus fluvialis TaxID=2738 RepID=UPI003B5BAAAB
MAEDKDQLYEKLKRNLKSPTFKDVNDALEAHGLRLEQNSGKSTHFTIACDIPNFFEPLENRIIVKHSKNLIPPYGKKALTYIERMRKL